jgi:hypothetical protein
MSYKREDNVVSFRILDVGFTSESCQIVVDELFFYLAYIFRNRQKHKICQVKFGKHFFFFLLL